jgi:hypothetical protein
MQQDSLQDRIAMTRLLPCRKLMTQTAFEPSYTGVTKDGAEWIVKRDDIRLVGIDYLSVAPYEDLIGPHIALLTDVSFHPQDPSTVLNAWGLPLIQSEGTDMPMGSCNDPLILGPDVALLADAQPP